MRVTEFLAAAQKSEIMNVQRDDYQVNFTIDDHGLSRVTPGLKSLSRISMLILLLSGLATELTVVTISVLHVLQKRREIAAFRALGVKKHQVIALTLTGLLLICTVGAAVGAWVGQTVSGRVTEYILDTAALDEIDDSFSTALVQTAEEDAVQLTAQSDPATPWLTAGGIALVMAALTVALTWRESGKPPIQMIGTKE